MKKLIKDFIFYALLIIFAAIVFRLSLPKIINVSISGPVSVIGSVDTDTDVSGNVGISGDVQTKFDDNDILKVEPIQ